MSIKYLKTSKVWAFLLGVIDFRSCVTWADPARVDGLTELDCAYDTGREFAHRITLRMYDN